MAEGSGSIAAENRLSPHFLDKRSQISRTDPVTV